MSDGFVVSREWLVRCATRNGSWSPEQIQALGLPFPPPKTWFDDLDGQWISEESANQFIRLSAVREIESASPRETDGIRESIVEASRVERSEFEREIKRFHAGEMCGYRTVPRKIKINGKKRFWGDVRTEDLERIIKNWTRSPELQKRALKELEKRFATLKGKVRRGRA